jgi:16S rRNA C1402 N4-methylase RsmH
MVEMKYAEVRRAVKKFAAVRAELNSKLGKLEKTLDKRLVKIETKLAKLKT